jgi:ABC transport system ATP-binding/permease protein
MMKAAKSLRFGSHREWLQVVGMNTVVLPVLTVRGSGSQRTFAAGHDVVIGRDLRADMRITHR